MYLLTVWAGLSCYVVCYQHCGTWYCSLKCNTTRAFLTNVNLAYIFFYLYLMTIVFVYDSTFTKPCFWEPSLLFRFHSILCSNQFIVYDFCRKLDGFCDTDDKPLGSTYLRKPQKSSCNYICQYCLVHLGDIARYRNQNRQAESFYRCILIHTNYFSYII